MPRLSRQISSTGIYHAMLRGIDGRDIFLDQNDKRVFLRKVAAVKKKVDFNLYAYCLMNNHVHLLVKESEEIGTSIKRIAVGYVQWHNHKYGRRGHLFQNRFRSEPVETEAYFKTVLRYIHLNPVKANMVHKPEDYRWSSYGDYCISHKEEKSITDTEIVGRLFSSKEDFITFMAKENEDQCLEHDEEKRLTDGELKAIIGFLDKDGALFSNSLKKRDEIIKKIYESTGVSIRQLSRVTGKGKRIIERAVK